VVDKPAAKKGLGCVVVLGMHRSGTSLVAGILERLGVRMGERFREPDVHNPDGYYEDLDWRDLNKKILRESHGSWWEPPAEIDVISLRGSMAGEIHGLVDQKQEDAAGQLWGFKDPRTALTIPLIHDFLPDPFYVCVRRSVPAVVQSLMRRAEARGYYESAKHWQDLVSEYERRRTRFLRQGWASFALLTYEQLLTDTWGNVLSLAHFVGQRNRDVIRYAADLVRVEEPAYE
jgi:hypothetical protein